MKKCSRCKQVKSSRDFYLIKAQHDSLSNNCRSCHREFVRQYARTEKGKLNDNNKYQRMKSKYPEKFSARWKLKYAVRSGKIVRPDECDVCHRAGIPDGHHKDYSKPFEVDWLCGMCHKQVHGKLVDLSLLNNNTRRRNND